MATLEYATAPRGSCRRPSAIRMGVENDIVHVKKFVGLGLIKKKKMGHTNELSLSEDFYDYFNIDYSNKDNPLKEVSVENSQ